MAFLCLFTSPSASLSPLSLILSSPGSQVSRLFLKPHLRTAYMVSPSLTFPSGWFSNPCTLRYIFSPSDLAHIIPQAALVLTS